MAPIPLRTATGLWRRDGSSTVFIPFDPSAHQRPADPENIRHEAQARHHIRPGLEDVALALITMNDGAGACRPVSARCVSTGVARRDPRPLPAGELTPLSGCRL
jgi:hypothetical protein